MRLSDLNVGSTATIDGFFDDTPVESVSRFKALGFLHGAEVIVERHLPFGGPLVVNVGGCAFALERAASSCVRVVRGEAP